jgi:competence protein ComEC
LLYELNLGVLAGTVDFQPALTLDRSGTFDYGEVHIEVLAPSPYLAGKGPGSTDRENRRISTNSVSAVIRLTFKEEPLILFTGDLDHVGLQNISRDEIDMRAPIVVFPHHGGLSGSADIVAFTQELCERTGARTMVFSIGRGQYGTPNPEVIATVRRVLPDVRIACTQLSERCATTVPATQPGHLSAGFARGKERRACCAGSIRINLADGKATPEAAEHRRFVDKNAPTGLCR